MENNNDSAYVFWLNFWKDASASWPKTGHFKCVITKAKISITPSENDRDKELHVDLSSIQKCKTGYSGNNNRHVELFLSDRRLLLGPVHPIDPNHYQNLNRNETSSLI